MNKERRAKIASLVSRLECLLEQERDYLDNVPESLRSSEQSGNAEGAIDYLEAAIDSPSAI